MKLRTRRNGIALALAGAIAALLMIEPVNGPKRRARIQRVLMPAGRPLQAMRRRITGQDEAEAPERTSLAERLQHVAVRAQGQIDLPVEPDPSAATDVTLPDVQVAEGATRLEAQQSSATPQPDDAAPAGEDGEPRTRHKKSETAQ
jgi:hypothetical protein